MGYYFPGVNSYISLGDVNDLEYQAQFTISVWFNWVDNAVSYETIVMKLRATGSSIYYIREVAGKMYGQMYLNGADKLVGATATLTQNQWYHYVMVYDGANLRGYLDGVLIGAGSAATGLMASSANNLIIGSSSAPAAGNYWKGSIADLAFWNIGLSEAQVNQIFKARRIGMPLMIAPANLLAYYPLDEFGASGGVASGAGRTRDRGPSGYHGTPTNSPTGTAAPLSYRGRPIFPVVVYHA